MVTSAFVGACGGGGGEPEATLAGSHARWIGSAAESDSFDATLQKTDPEIVGVEVGWEYTLDDPGPVTPDLTAVLYIDDQRTLGSSHSGGVLGGGALDQGALDVIETDSGFRVRYLVSLTAVSDLEQFAAFLRDTGVEAEDSVIEDRGGDGVLEYRISVLGEVEAEGTIDISEELTFEVYESDPAAEQVPDDPAVLAQLYLEDAVGEAEDDGCEVTEVLAAGSSLEITSPDGSVSATAELPGWQLLPNDPNICFVSGVNAEPPLPEGERSGPTMSIRLVDLRTRSLADELEHQRTYLLEGDPEFADLEPFADRVDPLEELTIAGLPAVRLTAYGTYEGIDDIQIQQHLYVDAGTFAIEIVTIDSEPDWLLAETATEEIVDALEIVGGA